MAERNERNDEPDPIVSAIAPYEKFALNSGSKITTTTTKNVGSTGVPGFAEVGVQWEKSVTEEVRGGSLVGMMQLRGRTHGPDNTAVWLLEEDQLQQTGVPARLRTAVMLERSDHHWFLGKLEIETDVAGFSFRDFQSGLATERDDPIVFDPNLPPMGPELMLDERDLGSVNLEDYILESPVFPTAEAILQVEQEEHENLQTVVESIESVAPEPEAISKKAEDLGTSSSVYAELWNHQSSGEIWLPSTSSNVKVRSTRFKAPAEEIKTDLSTQYLEQYFSWIKEPPSPPLPPEQQKRPPKQTTLFSLIFRRSDRNEFSSFDQLTELLGQPPVKDIVEFFEFPPEYMRWRQHDRGICRLIPSKKDGKPIKAYMIQTPFYGGGGFWSLVMISMTESDGPDSPSKTSAVIQTEQVSDLDKLFFGVEKSIKSYGRHPLLLLLELFREHCDATSTRFISLLAKVKNVDERLLAELEIDSKPGDARKEYRELSRRLHKNHMELEELGRRRKFEEKFGKRLSDDLRHDSGLSQVVAMYADISQSRDVDIESLPGKLESQRNVLSSLIAQYDNKASSKLAKESLRDSKAMKTLSILTILFLPGAFVATVFSTDMFDFRDKKQEIWVYFVIVVPLTAILMTGWYFWLRETPENGDEEAGAARPKEKSTGNTKEGKSD